MNNDKEIRLALVVGMKEYQTFLREQFAWYRALSIVHEGRELNRDVKQLVAANPHIIFIAEGMPNTFHYEINPRFPKIRRLLPDAKILLTTELAPTHPFLQSAREAGVNIISQSFDIPKVVEAIRQVHNGEHVVWYKDKGQFLESAHSSRSKEW